MSKGKIKINRTKTKSSSSSRKSRWLRVIFSLVVFSATIFFFIFLFFIHDLPDLNNLETKGRRASVIFESYDGKVLAVYGDLFKKVVKVDSLPKYVSESVLAIEDKRFYSHCGVDFIGIFRAAFANLMHREIVQGGSTLTQQLAKNLFFSCERSLKRKIQEVVLALWLEKKFTKKQILSIYLNRVYFGAGAYGIDAAAYRFFGKRAEKLTLYEAATLAGLLKSPSAYSPFYNAEKSRQRTELVLDQMVKLKYITDVQRQNAIAEQIKKNQLSVLMDENRYFTDWVLEQMQKIVNIDEEDLIVRTTLNARLQRSAAHVVREILTTEGFKNGVSQMALVALDKNGAVRAMIGGHTYSLSQFNRALALRSFGSSFKYFVFLTALEHGFCIYDQISDMPLSIGHWSPKNYHYQSVGSISLINAFVKSVNTCSVRLAQRVGLETVIAKAHLLGITSPINKDYSSALGSSGVNLLEMTAAYGTTMNNGMKMTPFGIVSIKNKKGKQIYRAYQRSTKRVVAPEVCAKMKTMLHEIMVRGTGRNANLPQLQCYGKTGTSNDSRDASFIGFASPLVTGVWIGNDDNSPMNKKITGGTLPAKAWKEFMSIAFGSTKDKTEIPDSKMRGLQRSVNKKKKMKAILEKI